MREKSMRDCRGDDMRRLQDLSDSEKDSFVIEMAEIQSDATEKVIKVADKYGISRDETMKRFTLSLKIMTVFGSFENCEISEEEANEKLES